jgi:murein biosynthesis integral membrane protein MurJ
VPILPEGRRKDSGARNSATVAAWTLVSKITGVARVSAIAAVLGPTYFANVFAASNVTPNLVFGVVAGPAVAMVLVPALVSALSKQGAEEAAQLLGRVTGFLLTVAGALGALLVVVAPVLAWTTTAGIDDERARAFQLGLVLLILVAPQVPLYTLAAVGAAAQQARGRFALAAAAPAMENIGLIATMAVVATAYRPGLEVGQVPFGLAVALGLGSTAAVGAHAATQLIGAAAAGLTVRPRRWRSDEVAGEIAMRFRRSVSVTALPSASYLLLVLLAATVPGGVLVFQLAWLTYQLPAALGARAVSAAVLPGLAAAGRDDLAAFASSWRRALSYVVYVSLPFACLMMLYADSIANVLANGELRSSPLVGSIATCIAVLGVAQLAASVQEIGRQALFARLDLRGPRNASVLSLLATIGLGACTLLLPVGSPRLVGLSVVVLVTDLAAAILIIALLRAALRPEPTTDLRQIAAASFAVVAMLPPAVVGYSVVHAVQPDRLGELGILAAAGAGALVLYAFVVRALSLRRGEAS